jgi:hypothetical protein
MVLVTVKFPVCWPALKGRKSICAVQELETSRVDPQVEDEILNPADAESARSEIATGPLFLNVTN